MNELTKALVAAQAAMPELQRDKINPHFKSRYLSLETLLAEVLPVLNQHGLAVTQWPTYIETETGTRPALRTVLVHGESGKTIEDTMLLLAQKEDPQGQGSAITYAKRYALMALCGLSADEDDDGNAATGNAGNKSSRGRKPAAATQVDGAITAQQRAELQALVRERRIPTARAREIVRAVADADDSAKIPTKKLAAVRAALEAETT